MHTARLSCSGFLLTVVALCGLTAGCVPTPSGNGFIENRHTTTVMAYVVQGHWPLDGPLGLVLINGPRREVVIRQPVVAKIHAGPAVGEAGFGPQLSWANLPPGEYTFVYHCYRGGLLCSQDFGITHAEWIVVDPRRYGNVVVDQGRSRMRRVYMVAWHTVVHCGSGIPTLTQCFAPNIIIDFRPLNPMAP